MGYSFLFSLMQNYENRSRNARLIVEKLLASFFSDTVYMTVLLIITNDVEANNAVHVIIARRIPPRSSVSSFDYLCCVHPSMSLAGTLLDH